ncbi:TIGR00341 family protein [Corallincola spongiicola]|uniref:TIGR00341 family protein n=1 Tax=Corallincola spongiicola TaxID=2520508 RepID=A0ABY1WS91_9GAMM|nr:TIGR00341 family protein [Corallincola spongiicola]TAA47610.1 TIGR00341 family protein [Corallincola spongiicola]
MMCFLLFDMAQQEVVKKQLLPMLAEHELTPVAFNPHELPNWPEDARVLLYLSDDQISELLPCATDKQWQFAFLPHPNAVHAIKGGGVSSKLLQAVEDGLNNKARSVDLLLCNGRLVLNSVVIGDVFGLRPGGAIEGVWAKFKHLLSSGRRLGELVPKRYELITGNDEKIVTAAMGITVVEHGKNSVMGRRLLPGSHINDGMFHAILLAPRSLMEMYRFLLSSVFHRNSGSVPRSVGIIKTASLSVRSNGGMEYRHDGCEICAKELVFENQAKRLSLVSGRLLAIEEGASDSKEQRKIQHLPSGGAIEQMTKRPLSWIAHAATDEFKELYQALRENATPSNVFLTLMILSTLLASVGLFANSPPVIIGAMILAPLMGPIISLAMAIARQDESLLKGSLYTLFTGLALALGFAVVATWLIPLQQVTPEISARLRPNLLDLAVAVISGIAGAYAHARAALAKSLAGVAIAVALVPPLAVTGIGIGWGDTGIMWGAFLLFLTNLSGIVLAGAVTFLVLGFAPFSRAKRGLILSALAVALVSIPLALSFVQVVHKTKLIKQLEGRLIDDIRLAEVRVVSSRPITVSVKLVAPRPLTASDYQNTKRAVEAVMKQPVVLEASSSLRLQ